ncbi:MAG: hypothetical protein JRJ29_02365 [Deltaproteobacteria bacterium]|nr:hypothetical protein [Deltaproteobacteria bacterium]
MISESMDRTLPVHQRTGIRVHLLMCKFCSRYRKQLLYLRKTIRSLSAHGEEIYSSMTLSREAKERISSLLEKHQQGLHGRLPEI